MYKTITVVRCLSKSHGGNEGIKGITVQSSTVHYRGDFICDARMEKNQNKL